MWREITLSRPPGLWSPHHRVTPPLTFSFSLSPRAGAWASAPWRAQDTGEQWDSSKMFQEFECQKSSLSLDPALRRVVSRQG